MSRAVWDSRPTLFGTENVDGPKVGTSERDGVWKSLSGLGVAICSAETQLPPGAPIDNRDAHSQISNVRSLGSEVAQVEE